MKNMSYTKYIKIPNIKQHYLNIAINERYRDELKIIRQQDKIIADALQKKAEAEHRLKLLTNPNNKESNANKS
jgi:hypothetical protein